MSLVSVFVHDQHSVFVHGYANYGSFRSESPLQHAIHHMSIKSVQLSISKLKCSLYATFV